MKHNKPDLKMRKNPVQPRSLFTINVILDAAKRITKESGIKDLNTNTLAEIAGIGVGTIYQYFADTEAIIAELRRRHRSETNKLLYETLSSCNKFSFEETLRQLATGAVNLHTKEPELHKVLMKYTDIGKDFDFEESKVINDAPMINLLEKFICQSLEVSTTRAKTMSKVLFFIFDSLIHSVLINEELNFSEDALIDEVVYSGIGYLKESALSQKAI